MCSTRATHLGGGVGEDGGRDVDGDVVHVERSEEVLERRKRADESQYKD